jgi:hypothetical protein
LAIAVDQAVAAVPAAPPKAPACLNCGTPVAGKFCAECGQSREDHSRSLRSFLHELVEHHLLLDGKTLRTAYALVLRPGELTRAYIEGRRARYVSPIRLYLFMSFAFFLALYASGLAVFQVTGKIDIPSVAFRTDDVAAAAATQQGVDARLADALSRADAAASAAETTGSIHTSVELFRPVQDGALEFSAETKARIASDIARGTERERRISNGMMQALQHPRMLNTVLDEWVPKLFVLLLPVAALLLAPFGFRRGLFYVDHLAFALHGQAFCFLLGTLTIGARRWLPDLPLGWIFGAIILVWTLLAYRRVYRSGWFGTVLKVGIIGSAYAVVLFAMLLVAMIYGVSELPT